MKKGSILRAAFRIMGIIVLILGIRMFGAGIWNYVDEHNQKDWIITTAEVMDVSGEYTGRTTKHTNRVRYDITYQYEANGREYSDKLYNRSKPLALGNTIKIKYDPAAPENSTDILAPSVGNLILFLAMGIVFSMLGFFLSGAYALIRRIRRRGEPEDEEVLPPEEYVDPETMKMPPQKPAASIVRRIVFVVIVLGGIFLWTKQFPGTQSVNVEQFKNIVEAEGYTTSDTTEKLQQEWRVGSLLKEATSFNNGNIRMDFCVMDTVDSAGILYNSMTLPLSEGEKEEHDGIVHAFCSIESEALYVVKIRIRDTVIYVSAQVEYKSEVEKLLKELGYWKE